MAPGGLEDLGVFEFFADEVLHGVGCGGGEEGELGVGWALFEDAVDDGQEAGVEHLVGFVEDEDADVVEGEAVALDELLEAPRGGDEDFKGAVDVSAGLGHGGAAEAGADADAGVVGEVFEGAGDLLAEVAGGYEDYCPRKAFFGDGVAVVFELLEGVEDGKGVSEGLAGAGLGDAGNGFAF